MCIPSLPLPLLCGAWDVRHITLPAEQGLSGLSDVIPLSKQVNGLTLKQRTHRVWEACHPFLTAQGSTSLSATISQIAAASPNSLAALVGGQVVPGYHPSAQLTPGAVLNTTDKVNDGNGSTVVSVTVDPASVNGPVQVRPSRIAFRTRLPFGLLPGTVWCSSYNSRHGKLEACCALVPCQFHTKMELAIQNTWDSLLSCHCNSREIYTLKPMQNFLA